MEARDGEGATVFLGGLKRDEVPVFIMNLLPFLQRDDPQRRQRDFHFGQLEGKSTRSGFQDRLFRRPDLKERLKPGACIQPGDLLLLTVAEKSLRDFHAWNRGSFFSMSTPMGEFRQTAATMKP